MPNFVSQFTGVQIEDKLTKAGTAVQPEQLTKAAVGLGNVDNTSDLDKPVSTDTQAALDDKVSKVTSTDNALVRFDGTTGAVQNSSVVVSDTNAVSGVSSLQLTGGTGTEGTLSWNAGDGTVDVALAGGQSVLQVGQEQLVRVLNNTGTTLTDRQVVYITGAQGQRPTVALADADLEASSSNTIGIVTETIANAAEGFVTLSGLVRNVNTSSWAEGTMLYLSSTAGSLTSVKPVPPAHAVRIGWVVRQHATAGSILVHVQNGYELDELHDVLISSLTNGQVLAYDSATALWKNVDNNKVNSTAGTASGLTLNDGYTEEVFTVTGTAPALSPTNGSIQTWTLTGNSTPTLGTWASGQSITLMIDDGTAYAIDWTSMNVVWKTGGGVAPTLLVTGYTALVLVNVGGVLYGWLAGNA